MFVAQIFIDSLQLLSKPLSTHTRFNKDRILSKPPFYMIFPFVFFHTRDFSVLYFCSFGTLSFLWWWLLLLLLLFISIFAFVVSMMDFFSFVMYRTRKMRFFYEYENHARDMPGDGRAIDYYVIQSNAVLFIGWLPSRCFFFTAFFRILLYH